MKRLRQLLPLFLFGIILIGVVLGMYLLRNNQDIRQQASEGDTSEKVEFFLTPGSTTFTDRQQKTIELKVNIQANQANISSKELPFLKLAGNIPSDIQFEFFGLPGAPQTSIEKKINADSTEFWIKINNDLQNPYLLSPYKGQTATLGKILFSPPESGEMNISFISELGGVIKTSEGLPLVQLQSSQLYTFNSITPSPSITASPTPVATVSVTSTPTPAPTPIASTEVSSSSPLPTVTVSSTPSPTTFIATATPTSTDTPTVVVNSPSPEPTSSASVTLSPTPFPTNTALPVSATTCRADINKDGIVDLEDYALLRDTFFSESPTPPEADLNADGIVDVEDYAILSQDFFCSTQ